MKPTGWTTCSGWRAISGCDASSGGRCGKRREQWKSTGQPARVFAEFGYRAKKTKKGGWDRERRVVAKAEHIDGKENPRFVVTSLSREQWAAQALYEELYCARGDMENRIKEQLSLFADRVSAETMRANQLRLYFSVMAYVLVSGLRRLGLKATELAQAQVSTIRTKLLKIGAQVRVTVRKVWVSMASSYPWQAAVSAGLGEPALLVIAPLAEGGGRARLGNKPLSGSVSPPPSEGRRWLCRGPEHARSRLPRHDFHRVGQEINRSPRPPALFVPGLNHW